MSLTSEDLQLLDEIWRTQAPVRVNVYRNLADTLFCYIILYFNTAQQPSESFVAQQFNLVHADGFVFVPYCTWYTQYSSGFKSGVLQQGGCLL